MKTKNKNIIYVIINLVLLLLPIIIIYYIFGNFINQFYFGLMFYPIYITILLLILYSLDKDKFKSYNIKCNKFTDYSLGEKINRTDKINNLLKLGKKKQMPKKYFNILSYFDRKPYKIHKLYDSLEFAVKKKLNIKWFELIFNHELQLDKLKINLKYSPNSVLNEENLILNQKKIDALLEAEKNKMPKWYMNFYGG